MNCITFTTINTKLRLTDGYQYDPEEEEEKQQQQQQQASKKPDKKEPPKKTTKDDLNKFNEQVIKNETGINRKLFEKHFKFHRLSDMLKTVYNTNDKKENSDLVNVIKDELSDSKNEIEDMGEEEKQVKNQMRQLMLLK